MVPNLLVLSPHCSLDWTRHPLISSGKIVLQDKSSCFSALALVHGQRQHTSTNTKEESIDGDFIDACAAPGNKCQHLAALVAQRHVSSTLNEPPLKSRIFALDKSGPRIKILKERMEQFKAEESSSTVEIIPIHQDFLKIHPCDSTYAHVKSILLDPSCSGSGIVNTPDRRIEGEDDKNQDRIQALANFQLLALKHAMSFPQVCRIVYSTCSIHEEENEEVVCLAMEEINRNIKEEDMKWVIASPYALRQWHRRGHSNMEGITQDQAQALIRVDGSDGDETNGFFVCYFERLYYYPITPPIDCGLE
jgi:putative methyltransferase